MSPYPTLTAPRLVLRPWRDEDLPAYAAMNADPRVMQFFQKTWTPQESAATLARVRDHFDRHGFGKWAVEAPGVAPLVGIVGLAVPDYDLPFNPCVEMGWRLAAEFWGRGYATEAARAALDFALGELGLREVVAFTVPTNVRSRAVMERLGMTRNPAEDFDHPMIPPGHALGRHVLYRLQAPVHARAR